jgi:hypothetical protein
MEAAMKRPSGIATDGALLYVAAQDGRIYIADTNNHRICVAEPSSKIVTALPLQGA